MDVVLKLEGVTKVFPKVIANDNVDLELRRGEVHALLGENGAGKTTLMNCVYGMYTPTSGRFFVKGEEVRIHNSHQAIDLGIGMVHQHFMLIPRLTVAENVILGLRSDREPLVNLETAEKKIQALSDQYHFGLDPRDRVMGLPVGMQQRVEILKVLYRQADILILDEATAVLTPQETRELFNVIRKLTREGKSILMITHKLEEVMALADRVTVLRDGKVAGHVNKEDTNPNELANMMVGRDVLFDFDIQQETPGDVLLEAEGLTVVDDRNIERVRNVSFQVRAGEVLGIAGVDGNGQIQLTEALTGLHPYKAGTVTIKGKKYQKLRVREAYEQGVSHIPQDRQKTGLVLALPIKKNLVLTDNYRAPFSRRGIIDYRKVTSHGTEMVKEYDVRTPSCEVPAKELSGGNQQKVILARELCRDPDILIAVQPTRGLDIGATEFVRQKILDQRARGAAVVLVSTELEEILQLADRIAVMHAGEFMGVVRKGEVSVNEIGLMMAGTRRDPASTAAKSGGETA